MKLPGEFIENMKKHMECDELGQFIDSLQAQPFSALRVNTAKLSVDEFLSISPFKLAPVQWCPEGFYFDAADKPGKHPYYHAGLYYIQEPSAMFPVKVLAPEAEESILDMCAAPGGKTVQIACRMNNAGFLLSNDINADRTRALVKNIELCGIRNAFVACSAPESLVARFAGYFDGILVDAPCSGEGMFRRDEHAVKSWRKYSYGTFTAIQDRLLGYAAEMTRSGGRIVYSTCTFSPEEDEVVISRFLKQHPGFELKEINKTTGMEDGRPEWGDGSPALRKTARLWPHRIKGEGHFVALLVKNEEVECKCNRILHHDNHDSTVTGDAPEEFIEFIGKHMEGHHFFGRSDGSGGRGRFIRSGDGLYWAPVFPERISGMKCLKYGVYLGNTHKGSLGSLGSLGSFRPSQSLVLALSNTEFKRILELDADSSEIIRYLKGETLLVEGDKGLIAVCADRYPIGWAAYEAGYLKNMYPAGWRMLK